MCSQLVEAGWRVYSCATSQDSLEDLPDGVHGWICDVSNAASVDETLQRFGERESRLDLLVNNAGILGPRKYLQDVEPREWKKVFAVNADGPFFVTRAALPFLRAASGKLVNVSSSVGRQGRGGWGPYACSKHALEGMTDVFAEELSDDGIVVFSVNPGGTATDMRAEAYPDEDPDTLPSSEEIAAVIIDMAERATLADSGAKWNCRDDL